MDETTAVADGQSAGALTAAEVLYDHVMPDNQVQSIEAQMSNNGQPAAGNGGAAPATQAVNPTEYQLTLPDGYTATEAELQLFKDAARDMVLSNDQANALLKMHAEKVEQSVNQAMEQIGLEWAAQSKSDPEIGGARLHEHVRAADQVIKRFGGDKLREVLTQTRLGDHPEIIRFLSKIGMAMGEGAYNRGVDTPKAEEKSAADVLFDFGK